jgi:hypothetical protein
MLLGHFAAVAASAQGRNSARIERHGKLSEACCDKVNGLAIAPPAHLDVAAQQNT